MKKALILASIFILLFSSALSYQVEERISFTPPKKPIFLITIALSIDRTGKIASYGTVVRDEWWSKGYIDLVFRIPPNPGKKIAQINGKGTGVRIITGCVPEECAQSFSVHPVVYKVVDYKPKLRIKDWKIIGWKVRIKETWKAGKSYGKYWGQFDSSKMAPIPGFHMDTYWIEVPFRKGTTTTSSQKTGLISWKNKFKVLDFKIRIIGSTEDK